MDHYFSADPSSAGERRLTTFTLADRSYELVSAGGVFSAGRLDPGTAVLLRKAGLPGPAEPGPLLDLGCGYGPIACVLADRAPAAEVWAVDVNARARELTAENAARLGFTGRLRVAEPDQVPEALRFREIWSNPPIRVGKEELRGLLGRWLPRLTPDGTAWLVVARYLGGDSLQQWLTGQGWTVSRHASRQGYRILRVVRDGQGPGPGAAPDPGPRARRAD